MKCDDLRPRRHHYKANYQQRQGMSSHIHNPFVIDEGAATLDVPVLRDISPHASKHLRLRHHF